LSCLLPIHLRVFGLLRFGARPGTSRVDYHAVHITASDVPNPDRRGNSPRKLRIGNLFTELIYVEKRCGSKTCADIGNGQMMFKFYIALRVPQPCASYP